ncbi:tRNA (N(6)-L-threonylcarbamoyladenosine(37)-C(2))-methylthiotransferase MtaB [Paludibacter sp. 221]|uniref:tRNA (N(6)-L-threonylcarbamoyladenosine(37)-C(2))- methylthiotransferase MtaB n=1 Tax=Paludibacter sp. 221 TaxID=2302939 RepID=UPI0013D82407|nr:tRNA (N(6)-L-threonylcarbamoyladenosine(37)-C(2))-methylthiotransferase MtaB [Paludibacter sp. 221]NDV47642.1 tRNA (N(6)-L-threonylcarbamoyladenosine(37)-C(2))-methylthiotransferase MtaB [Paludibacter sp. 221]
MIDNSLFHNKKVHYHTLGCKLNFAETSSIGKMLSNEGFVKARAGEQADVCIVNTCSVTDTADHKCRQAINRLNRQHPNAVIIVTGCYAQLKPDEVAAIEGVDLVLGMNEKFDILEYLQKREENSSDEIFHSDILKTKKFRPACSRDGRTRFFLKVQDGCDYYCTYCTIPFARGHSRNASIVETVEAAKEAIAEGAKEIVLSGVNTGDFGKTTSEKFIDLVKALDALPQDIRFRISSIEPNLLTDELIEYLAHSRHFMPHFHIPLQTGSNAVLKLMKRRYTTEFFAEKIQTIHKFIPDAFIGVDVIVGVRGETEKYFQEAVNFIESLDISQLHVFSYSERAGTKMLEIEPVVSPAERKRRSEVLHEISAKKTRLFYEKQIGKTDYVLWESRKNDDNMVGFTENYIRVEHPYIKEHINTIQKVKLADWNEDKSAITVIY